MKKGIIILVLLGLLGTAAQLAIISKVTEVIEAGLKIACAASGNVSCITDIAVAIAIALQPDPIAGTASRAACKTADSAAEAPPIVLSDNVDLNVAQKLVSNTDNRRRLEHGIAVQIVKVRGPPAGSLDPYGMDAGPLIVGGIATPEQLATPSFVVPLVDGKFAAAEADLKFTDADWARDPGLQAYYVVSKALGWDTNRFPAAAQAEAFDATIQVMKAEGYNLDFTTNTASQVSSDDQLAQRLFVGVGSKELAEQIMAEPNQPGGLFIRSSGDDNKVSDDLKFAVNDIQAKARIPLLISTDQEYTQWVNSLGLANGKAASELANMPEAEVKAEGKRIGSAMFFLGFNMIFAPVVDYQDPANPVIGKYDRGISGDPGVISQIAGWFADGLTDGGVAPTLKHFPGHGKSSGDSHVTLPTTADWSVLQTTEVLPFKDLANKPKAAIMVGHLNVPGLTDGKPASQSPAVYEYLKSLGFGGLTITDELGGMVGAGDGSLSDKIAASLNAGANMALYNVNSIDEYRATLQELKSKVVNSTATPVLAYKQSLGLKVAVPTTPTELSGTTYLPDTDDVNQRMEVIFTDLVRRFSTVMDPAKAKIAAAGVMGNTKQESGYNPKILEYGSGNGHGLVQWSFDRWRDDGRPSSDNSPPGSGITKNSLLGFATAQGKDWTELGVQMDFIWYELTEGNEKRTLEVMKTVTDPADAASKWSQSYERAGAVSQDSNRVAEANAVYAKFKDLEVKSNTVLCAEANQTFVAQTTGQAPTGQPAAGGGIPLNLTGDQVGRSMSYYRQCDPRWTESGNGYNYCGCACGQTSVAILLTTLKADANITPISVYNAIGDSGSEGSGKFYPNSCAGSSVGVLISYLESQGMKTSLVQGRGQGGLQTGPVLDQLKQGHPMLVHTSTQITYGNWGSGSNGTSGHYLVLYGADADGSHFYVANPGGQVDNNLAVPADKITAWLDEAYAVIAPSTS